MSILHRLEKVSEWLSNCGLEVCRNALCLGARCKIFSQSPPRSHSTPPPMKHAKQLRLFVELYVNEEQEVVLEMEEHRSEGVEEDEEMLGVDELEDEGTSGLQTTVILNSGGEGVEDTEEDEVS